MTATASTVKAEGDARQDLLPVSAVIPTRNRALALRRTLESLAAQTAQPAQIVLVDASEDRSTYETCIARPVEGLAGQLEWVAGTLQGAAAQRNQAIKYCTQDLIAFFDDDILFEPNCMARLYRALQSDARLGGVNAMIVNQRYTAPGVVSRLVFCLMAGGMMPSYAGRLIGPAVNLLPEDRDDLPETVPVEWLNTTCTLYRREALPDPPFPPFFTGYSMMEDVALSSRVAQKWGLANARTARIHHESQPGEHKSDPVAIAQMELTNRHYVMTRVLARRRLRDYAKLFVWELFQLTTIAIQRRGGRAFWQSLEGKLRALVRMIRGLSNGAST